MGEGVVRGVKGALEGVLGCLRLPLCIDAASWLLVQVSAEPSAHPHATTPAQRPPQPPPSSQVQLGPAAALRCAARHLTSMAPPRCALGAPLCKAPTHLAAPAWPVGVATAAVAGAARPPAVWPSPLPPAPDPIDASRCALGAPSRPASAPPPAGPACPAKEAMPTTAARSLPALLSPRRLLLPLAADPINASCHVLHSSRNKDACTPSFVVCASSKGFALQGSVIAGCIDG